MTTPARAKGNRLEKMALGVLQHADGRDPAYAHMETSTGRLGQVYRLQMDGATRHLAVECKNDERWQRRLWEYLAKLRAAGRGKAPVLVIKRNGLRPLAVIDLDDYCALLRAAARDRTAAHRVDL